MKRLLPILGLALVVVAFSGYWLYAFRHASPQGFALRLSFQGAVQQVGPPTKQQLDVRSNYFSACPAMRDRGVQRDRVLRMVNTGQRVLTLMGFNPWAPFYTLEVKRHGTWSFLPTVYTDSGVRQQPRLSPGQALDFPVIVPEGAEAWRVALVYNELAATNRLADALDRLLSLLQRPPRSRNRPFIVRTEEVVE